MSYSKITIIAAYVLLFLACRYNKIDAKIQPTTFKSNLEGIKDSIQFLISNRMVKDTSGNDWTIMLGGINTLDTVGWFKIEDHRIFYLHPHNYLYASSHPAHSRQLFIDRSSDSQIIELYGSSLLAGRNVFAVSDSMLGERRIWKFSIVDSLSSPSIDGYSINSFSFDSAYTLSHIVLRLNNILVPFQK